MATGHRPYKPDCSKAERWAGRTAGLPFLGLASFGHALKAQPNGRGSDSPVIMHTEGQIQLIWSGPLIRNT